MLAHGAVLHKNGFSPAQIIQVLKDYHSAGLTPVEVHMMDYADKLSRAPEMVTQGDVDLLRQDGLNEQQVTDIALAVSVRNFISRYFAAIGAGPDPELVAREPELWDFLKDWETAAMG